MRPPEQGRVLGFLRGDALRHEQSLCLSHVGLGRSDEVMGKPEACLGSGCFSVL